MAGQARPGLQLCPQPVVLLGQALGRREGIFSSPRRRATAWHQPGWLLAARPCSTACPTPLAPVPGATPVTRSRSGLLTQDPAKLRKQMAECPRAGLCTGQEPGQALSLTRRCLAAPVGTAWVGNFSPCLSPVTGPSAPDTLWLSAAFIASYSRAGSSGAHSSAVTRNTHSSGFILPTSLWAAWQEWWFQPLWCGELRAPTPSRKADEPQIASAPQAGGFPLCLAAGSNVWQPEFFPCLESGLQQMLWVSTGP